MRQTQVRALLALAAAASLLVLSGCVRFTTQFVVKPEGGLRAKIVMGVDQRMGVKDAESGTPLEGLGKGPESKNWTTRQYSEDGWEYNEAIGDIKPGEKVFPGADQSPDVTYKKIEYRFSSRYQVALTVPPMPKEVTQPSTPDLGEQKPATSPEENTKAMEMMAENIMGNVQIRFRLGAPGRVLSSTGKTIGEGLVEWTPALSSLSDKNPEAMTLVTEVPNWSALGRLADKLGAECGMYDAGTRLGQALRQGLLPNPPASAGNASALQPLDYYRILDVIRKVEPYVPAGRLAEVIRGLGLSDEAVTAAQIKAVYDRANQADFTAHVENERVRDLVGWLGAK